MNFRFSFFKFRQIKNFIFEKLPKKKFSLSKFKIPRISVFQIFPQIFLIFLTISFFLLFLLFFIFFPIFPQFPPNFSLIFFRKKTKNFHFFATKFAIFQRKFRAQNFFRPHFFLIFAQNPRFPQNLCREFLVKINPQNFFNFKFLIFFKKKIFKI